MKQLARLLGFDPAAVFYLSEGELAFVAESSFGKKGWKTSKRFSSLAELDKWVGGQDASEQLRKLALTSLKRMYFSGLVTRDDLQSLLQVERREALCQKRRVGAEEYKFSANEGSRRVVHAAPYRMVRDEEYAVR